MNSYKKLKRQVYSNTAHLAGRGSHGSSEKQMLDAENGQFYKQWRDGSFVRQILPISQHYLMYAFINIKAIFQ